MESEQEAHRMNVEKTSARLSKRERGREQKCLVQAISFELSDTHDWSESEESEKGPMSTLPQRYKFRIHFETKYPSEGDESPAKATRNPR